MAKLTQEKAANLALREMLSRCEEDPTMKQKMDRVKAIKEEFGEPMSDWLSLGEVGLL